MSMTMIFRPTLMKTIGLLGGMSSQATVEYYRLINAAINARLGSHEAAELLLNSVNFGNIEHWVRGEEWVAAGNYLARKARQLEMAGADFVLLGTNTMHRVADAIEAELTVPLIHIVDVTAEALQQAGVGRVGILGTRPTMEAAFYRERFERHGIAVVAPDTAARGEIDRIIFDELCKGVFLPESRRAYLATMAEMADRGAEGIVLGCTEIMLLIGQDDFPRLPLFDTTRLHAARAVALALGSA